MSDLAIIVPSRGRPDQFSGLFASWRSTTRGRSELVACLDDDDPTGDDYPPDAPGLTYMRGPRRGLVSWTNSAAIRVVGRCRAIASLGDDHRLVGDWEDAVLDALDDLGTGIVYGDDGIQGESLPTACFMTSDIVAMLGFMAPPPIEHLYCDNYWLELGRRAGCLRYLPHVSTPHLHPIAGRGEWDDTYREGNSSGARDRRAFDRWVVDRLDDDAAKVRLLRG